MSELVLLENSHCYYYNIYLIRHKAIFYCGEPCANQDSCMAITKILYPVSIPHFSQTGIASEGRHPG